MKIEFLLVGLAVIVVHLVYAWRLWNISAYLLLPISVSLLTYAQLVIVVCIVAFISGKSTLVETSWIL